MAAYNYSTKVELKAAYIQSKSETVLYTAGAPVTAATRLPDLPKSEYCILKLLAARIGDRFANSITHSSYTRNAVNQGTRVVIIIKNIFDQVNKIVIDTGKSQGHYISRTQIEKLCDFFDVAMVAAEEGQDTPITSEFAELTTPEEDAKVRGAHILQQLKDKQVELALADPAQHGGINTELGKQESERASIPKLLKRLNSHQLGLKCLPFSHNN